MIINTIDLGYYDKFNIDKSKIKIWSSSDIQNLIKEKYPKYLDFYNNLILLKSKENIGKLFILKEFGGLYINIHLLNDNFITESFLLNSTNSLYNVVLWKNHYQQEIIHRVYGISTYLSDELIFIKKIITH